MENRGVKVCEVVRWVTCSLHRKDLWKGWDWVSSLSERVKKWWMVKVWRVRNCCCYYVLQRNAFRYAVIILSAMPSHRASPPFVRYQIILLDDTGRMRVNNLHVWTWPWRGDGFERLSFIRTSPSHDNLRVLHVGVHDEATDAEVSKRPFSTRWSIVTIHSVHHDHTKLHSTLSVHSVA